MLTLRMTSRSSCSSWVQESKTRWRKLLPPVYRELRLQAPRYFRRERADYTLQPTALVHEAYLRLVNQHVRWHNRAHFFGIAAQAMRRVLVDHARTHGRVKRGGAQPKETLIEANVAVEGRSVDLLALDEAVPTENVVHAWHH